MKGKYGVGVFAASLVLAFSLSACSSSGGYDSGYAEGHKVGYDEGSSVGYDEGYAEGYKVGYDEGGGIGYDNGYAAGQQAASESVSSEQVSESGTEFASAALDAWSGDLGAYHVEIKGARLSKDRDGIPALIVIFAWTNNSEKTTSASLAFREKAFQNGIQIDFSVSADCDYKSQRTDIRPGATLEVECAFMLTSETAPVEVEITDFFGDSGELLKATFNPAEL